MPSNTHVSPKQKVAIVTGGSRGIGQRIAERLSENSFSVIINYNSDEDKANKVVSGIRAAGGQATAIRGDVSDEVAIKDLFESAERLFGKVDVLVYAAGILAVKPVVDLELRQMKQIIQTNLIGTIVVNQQAARSMNSGGAIINLSSAITRHLAPGYSAYAASKGGLESFTKVLAKELGGRDITVNAVSPGPTETEMLVNDLNNSGQPELYRQAIIDMSPLKRVGQPDDIAEVILALAGPVRWISGQVIHVSGGAAI